MINFRRFLFTFLPFRLYKVYPALKAQYDDETGALLVPAITQNNQAINQLIATIVTLVIAIVGGALTGKGL